ncbi:MAG: DNA-processing protein DprA [Fimbriimonadaceae bacterium]|nr:DNA-processing protein DprA [Fimbriimonadaceae bacterium]
MSLRPTAEFWNRLLAAEIGPQKGRDLLKGLGLSRMEPVPYLLSHGSLTPAERKNAKEVPIQALERALAQGATVVPGFDLPERIRRHDETPPALFVWGDGGALEAPSVAIVGTRAASTYGKAAARKFSESLAKAGLVVVSGGALGIDAAAHEGSLLANGRTIAVLGGGIDNVYPSQHAGLYRRIRDAGCLVSRFAAGSKPSRYRFLFRNRLIALIADAVLVIEAPERSGALSTAHAAAEFGKPVLVVPANVDNANFRGSHELIRDGATLVAHPDHVLESVGFEPVPTVVPSPADLTPDQRTILVALAEQPLTAEDLVDETGLEVGVVMAEVTLLEMEGMLFRDGGRYAARL